MRPVYFPPQDLERDTGLRSCNPRLGYREVRMKGSFSGSPELKSQGMRIKRGGWTKDREFSPEVIIHS